MSRTKVAGTPILLAIDASAAVLAEIARSGDGYPPFNVERLARKNDQQTDRLRITLAVAGFSESELEVLVEAGQLVIRGRQAPREDGDFLFRGIARRQFQRSFQLKDGMDVVSASLRKGLLIIELTDPSSAHVVRKINISPSL